MRKSSTRKKNSRCMEERKEGVGYRTVMETRKKRNFQEDSEYGKRKSYEYKDIATFN